MLLAVHRGMRQTFPTRATKVEDLIRLPTIEHPSARRVHALRGYDGRGGFLGYYLESVSGRIVPLCTAMEGEWVRGTEHLTKRRDAQDIEALTRRVVRGTGPDRDQMVLIPTKEAAVVTWDLIGDRREVLSLTRQLRAIGAMRKQGHGRVRRWTCENIATFSLLDGEGRTRRHLPVEVVRGADRIDQGTTEPPYWHPGLIVPRIPKGTTATLIPELC